MWLTARVLPWPVVHRLADRIDLDALPACPLCLLDLAWRMSNDEPRKKLIGVLTHTSDWVWMEIATETRAQLARLQMRGVEHADEALADIEVRGWRSRLVRELTERLARRMADEIRERRESSTAAVLPFDPPA